MSRRDLFSQTSNVWRQHFVTRRVGVAVRVHRVDVDLGHDGTLHRQTAKILQKFFVGLSSGLCCTVVGKSFAWALDGLKFWSLLSTNYAVEKNLATATSVPLRSCEVIKISKNQKSHRIHLYGPSRNSSLSGKTWYILNNFQLYLGQHS